MTLWPGLAITAPLVLLGLLAIPLVLWLARAVPPPPRRQVFPPAALLAGVRAEEETPHRAPWWLIVLRALAIFLIVVGLSAPILRPSAAPPDQRPLVVVIDDGWASGPWWRTVVREARLALEAAEPADGSVRLVFTAPDRPRDGALDALTPADAIARLEAAAPKPWATDHAAARTAIASLPGNARVLYFSDGLSQPDTDAFLGALSRLGPVRVRTPDSGAVALTGTAPVAEGFRASLSAAPRAPSPLTVLVEDNRGRALGSARVRLPATGGTFAATIAVDAALARRAAAIRLAGLESAGAVRLLGAGDRRARVGLVAPATDAQPLVADAYFLQRALAPFADVTRGDAATLVAAGVDALVLPDAVPQGAEAAAIADWVERGGLLIRFAGPRFAPPAPADPGTAPPDAAAGDNLLPAPLRGGIRQLDGGVAFAGALGLAPFPADSPLAGLPVPEDVKVRRQVLVDPTASPAPAVWATLTDGSPLVVSRPLGDGRLVLVTTTAGPAWGDIALSGLLPALLQRTLALAGSSESPGGSPTAPLTAPLSPRLLIDGFGRLRTATGEDASLTAEAAALGRPGPDLAPGLYAGSGATRQIAVVAENEALPPLPDLPTGAVRAAAPADAPIPLGGGLLALGILFLMADALAALAIAGRLALPKLPRLRPATTAASAAAIVGLLALAAPALAPTSAQAQPAEAATPPLTLRLAWVRTGDASTDAVAAAGLRGLSRVVTDRTAAEPGNPIGVDPARDDLGAYPILFWVIPPSPNPPTPEALARLRAYLANGGMLFVDTRGNAAAARTALQGLTLPPLVAMPDGHTLTRAFYLLRTMPGRRTDTRLFVESEGSAASGTGDGASSVLLGDGDWLAAWAVDAQGRPLYAVEGGERGRELALRVGTNVVIYALTGTYKSDQVHVPALLDRIRR